MFLRRILADFWAAIGFRRRPRAFISYARHHREMVREMVGLLEVTNADVFFDGQISPGSKWNDELKLNLRDAETIVVFWCSHAKKSEWIEWEYTEAIKLGKRVVPVLMDHTELPEALKPFQQLKFRALCAPITHERPPKGSVHMPKPKTNFKSLSVVIAEACDGASP